MKLSIKIALLGVVLQSSHYLIATEAKSTLVNKMAIPFLLCSEPGDLKALRKKLINHMHISTQRYLFSLITPEQWEKYRIQAAVDKNVMELAKKRFFAMVNGPLPITRDRILKLASAQKNKLELERQRMRQKRAAGKKVALTESSKIESNTFLIE